MPAVKRRARVIRIRHESAPLPMGCRWCGVGKQDHCQLWVPGHGWHGWVEPTRAQIEARLRVRLACQRKPDPGQSARNAAGRQAVESAIKTKSVTEKE